MDGRYLDQQIAFAGISTVEQAERYFATVGVKLRQRIGGRHYVTLAGNYGVSSEELADIMRQRQFAGGGLTYGYDSFFGPLEATFNYFNKASRPSLYINLGIHF